MAVPQQLLQQLLALDESVRLEIARTLLQSVDASADDADREKLLAALERSIAQCDRGEAIPYDDAMAALRAKRAARAAR